MQKNDIIDSFHGEMAFNLPLEAKYNTLLALAGNALKITEQEIKDAQGTNHLGAEELKVLKKLAQDAAEIDTYTMEEDSGESYSKKQRPFA